VKPIVSVSEELNKVANGNFSGEELAVTTKDEIGNLARDFNFMKTNIQSLIRKVILSAEQVATSSEQLTASSEETSKATVEISTAVQLVASGATDSCNSLLETSESLDQVTDALQSLASNTTTLSQSSLMVAEQAKHGNGYVQQTVKQINSIHQKVDESSDVLKQLRIL